MAIDSRDKRLSMMNVGMAFSQTLPTPDATVNQSDRVMFLLMYSGTVFVASVGQGVQRVLEFSRGFGYRRNKL